MDTNKAIMLKAINQLIEGRQEVATHLQLLLSELGLVGQAQTEDLVAKVLGSFDKTISVLDSFEPKSSSSLSDVDGSQNASYDNDGKSEDSGASRKRFKPKKGKRGCYKRKTRSEMWTIQSIILDDAFTWRKYGQKEILNAKFPRSYYRCTHKYTQGCKATKQVQKVDLESRMFSITYIGNHTCNTKVETPKIVSCDHHDEIIMDSEHKSPSLTSSMKEEEENHEQHHHCLTTENDFALVWQENVFEEDHHHHHHQCASINVLDSPDHLLVFGACEGLGFSENEEFSIFSSCSNLS